MITATEWRLRHPNGPLEIAHTEGKGKQIYRYAENLLAIYQVSTGARDRSTVRDVFIALKMASSAEHVNVQLVA